MRICLQGLWRVGSVTSAALSVMGNEVVGLNLDASVVAGLYSGKVPIFEPGLGALLRDGIDARRLQFIDHPVRISVDVELIWVAYDTPVDTDNVADVEFVIAQVTATLPYLLHEATVMVWSQLSVVSVQRLQDSATALCPARTSASRLLSRTCARAKRSTCSSNPTVWSWARATNATNSAPRPHCSLSTHASNGCRLNRPKCSGRDS